MVSEKFKILVGKVKTKLSDIKPEDIANFAIKETSGSIPVGGQYIKDAIDEFSPAEKFEIILELNEISPNQFTELSKEIGVSVEYLQDIKTFTFYAFQFKNVDHEEIKELLLRLIKNQTKFEIREQKAEIIYNVAGDIVINNPITNKPVTIPSIQSILRKNKIKEGEFFRTEPAWVDFEQGFIVERNEVKDIIIKLESNDVQLVLGAPASGKTIILKNVGYRLANDGKKNVHIVELKGHSIDEVKLFFDTIPKMEDDNQIFIIDDAHLNLFYCERLVEEFKSKGKRNLIIGSRESREITEEHPKDGAEYQILSELSKMCIHVQAEDVTERMIETFLEKQYHIVLNREEGFLHGYKKDLWLLSWALKAYNPKKNSVEDDVICRNITKSIEKIGVGKEKDKINAQDAFLPLSIFYRFEIPIERSFMEQQLQIDGKTINKLIELQEIVETKDSGHKMLSLHHSSIAELYFGAYIKESDLGGKIKKNILNGKDKNDLEYCSFYRYLTTSDLRNTIGVFLSLNRDFSIEKGGLTLLRKLVEQDEIKKSIEIGINTEEDLEKIGVCVRGIAEANGHVAFELIKNIDIDVLSTKIEKETDIEKVGKCVKSIAAVNENRAMELAKSISKRIEKEEDLTKVGKCVAEISWTNKDVAARLANSISFRIDKERDIKKVLRLISVIAKANEQLLSKLIESISVRLKIENDIEKIREFIAEFYKVNKDIAVEFVNNIDINSISEKIKNGADIGKLGDLISDIESITEGVSFNLSENIDNDVLSSAINKEPSIAKISKCVSSIAHVNKNKGSKLANLIDIDGLSWKIKIKKNIEDIGKLISTIETANKDVGMKLSENIDIDILLSKIEIEKDIEKVLKCVNYIANVNESVGLRLIVGVSSRIDKEEDLVKFGDWVVNFSKSRNMELLRWVDSVSSKLDEEKDVGKIGGYIFVIARMGIYSDNILKINDFSAKIKEEKDIAKTGRLISAIEGMNEVSAKELVNQIDIDSLSIKIEKEVDTEKISLCVRNIARINEEVGLKLAKSVSANLEKETDIEKIGACVSDIARVNELVGLELAECVSKKILEEKDIKKIAVCVSDIARANEKVGWDLVDFVSAKLEKVNDIEKIELCLSDISEANTKVGEKLAKRIHTKSLSFKIHKEGEDIMKIAKLILAIGHANEGVAIEILRNLNKKLTKELEEKEPRVFLFKSVW
jgi:hypothetical protein